MREPYVNFENKVRFGRILEDLDTMAGKFFDLKVLFCFQLKKFDRFSSHRL